jgi:hypothetical protein
LILTNFIELKQATLDVVKYQLLLISRKSVDFDATSRYLPLKKFADPQEKQ